MCAYAEEWDADAGATGIFYTEPVSDAGSNADSDVGAGAGADAVADAGADVGFDAGGWCWR